MKLFHGSNVEVRSPRIIVANRALDFGAGFYTTSDESQAVSWSHTQTRRRGEGVATVTSYDFNEEVAMTLSVLRFEGPNSEWLEFVSGNRRGAYCGPKYDIVIGPVANDRTMPVINGFVRGSLDEETALLLLKPQALADQYAFLAERGLAALSFAGVRTYE